MDRALCQMCEARSDFVKAHVIPRSFYPDRGRGPLPLSVMSSKPGFRKQRSRIGVYDDHLVCASCERRFDDFDNYAAKLLLDNHERFRTLEHDGEIIAYEIEPFDYERLKLFSLSVLWRAAKSHRPEFKNVQLGRFERRLTEMIRQKVPGSSQTFGTIISRFSDIPFGYSGIIFPTTYYMENRKFYKFVMGSYVFNIKVDIGFISDPLDALLLQPNKPLTIVAQKFNGSPEYRAMFKLVRAEAAAS